MKFIEKIKNVMNFSSVNLDRGAREFVYLTNQDINSYTFNTITNSKIIYQNAQIPPVMECMNKITDAIAGIEIQLKNKEGEVVEDELIEKLQQPNQYQTWQDFISELTQYYLIFGTAFIRMKGITNDTPRVSFTNKDAEIEVLNPLNIEIVNLTLNDEDIYFIYRENGIEKYRFTRKSPEMLIIHTNNIMLDKEIYGESPIKVISDLITMWKKLDEFMLKTISQDGNVATFLSPAPIKEQPVRMDNEKERLLKERINRKDGSIVITQEPMEVTGVKMISPSDINFIEQKNQIKRQIVSFLGVPPELAGMPEAKTYNSMNEAKAALYENKVFLLLDKILLKLFYFLTKQDVKYKDMYFDYDKNQISCIQNKRAEYIKAIDAVTSWSVNEKREQTGMPILDELQDMYSMPFYDNKNKPLDTEEDTIDYTN